jgi:hypothetical protein
VSDEEVCERGVARDTTIKGGARIFSPVLKVPRQCPFVPLIEVCLKKGETLGKEEGKVLGCGIWYEQRREVEPGLYCL